MHAIARIHFGDGILMLPSGTPYEIETLLENLEWYTGRHRTVQLEIGNHHWRVEHGAPPDGKECARCSKARATLTFVNGSHMSVCPGCARAALGSRFASWPRRDPGRLPGAD
jgi:hypothetical protein